MMSPTVVARTLGADRCVILSLVVVAVLCLSHALAVVSDDDIVLTPWWGMRFATGEDAEIDCGVNTGGEANAVTIDWSDPAGKTIATNSSTRKTVRRHDKNNKVDSVNGAYSVLTMTLTNLTSADHGKYTCHATTTHGNVTNTLSKDITITVVSPDEQCGFEDKQLCGWESDQATRLQWRRLDGETAVTRAIGPRFDHTYGPSKHIGHFMAVDLPEQTAGENETRTSSLVSRGQEKHVLAHCLQFWYALSGGGRDVSLELNTTTGDNKSSVVVALWRSDKVTTGDTVRVDIPPQSAGYQMAFSTEACRDKCSNGVFVIDDVRIWQDSCTNVQEMPPDRRLKVRLVNGKKPTEGRLEVLHDGMWGSVCSRQFGDEEARVVCRMLGYSVESAKAKTNASFGAAPDNAVIWLQRLGCDGTETDIASCVLPGQPLGHTDCAHGEDASVVCTATPAKTIPSPPSPPGSPATPATTTIKPKQKPTPTAPPKTMTTTTTTTTTTTSTTTTNATTPTPVPKVTPAPLTQVPPNVTMTTTTKGPGKEKNATSNETKTKVSTTSTKLLYPSTTSNDTGEAPHIMVYDKRSSRGRHTGVVVVVTLVALVGAAILGVFFCKRKKIIKQNAYITFSTPKYRREQLPNNDFNMESPLTLSSNGYTVLA